MQASSSPRIQEETFVLPPAQFHLQPHQLSQVLISSQQDLPALLGFQLHALQIENCPGETGGSLRGLRPIRDHTCVTVFITCTVTSPEKGLSNYPLSNKSKWLIYFVQFYDCLL